MAPNCGATSVFGVYNIVIMEMLFPAELRSTL